MSKNPDDLVQIRQGDLTLMLDLLVMFGKESWPTSMTPDEDRAELERILDKNGRLERKGSMVWYRLGAEVGEEPWIKDKQTCLYQIVYGKSK